MTTLRYELLIKNDGERKRIRLLSLIYKILSIIFCVFAVIPVILGQSYMFFYYTFLGVAVCYLAYSLFFALLLGKYRREQIFENFTDGAEFHQAALNFKFNEFSKGRKRRFLLCGIILAALILLMAIVLTFFPEAAETVAVLAGMLIVADIFITVLADSFRQTKFVQAQLDHISFLQKHFAEVDNLSSRQRNLGVFKSVSDGQKLISYMYPNEQIRKAVNKNSYKVTVCAVIVGAIIGICLPWFSINEWYIGLFCLFAGFIVLIGALTFFQVKTTKRLLDSQVNIFQTDTEKYSHYITHHALTRKYQKNTNRVFLMSGIAILVLAAMLAIIFAFRNDMEAAVGVLFFSLLFWLVVVLVITFAVLFPKYRRKARKIEELIDAQLLDQVGENKTPFDGI